MGNKIKRICPVCQKEYTADETRLKWGRQTTCSRTCSYELRADKLANSIELQCPVCGKDFRRAPSQLISKHGSHFCSRKCHYAGRSLGLTKRVVTKPYNWTEAGIISIRKHSAYNYASGSGIPFPKTELAFADRLKSLNIQFVHQQVFEHETGAFCVDFFFPTKNLVIELDFPSCHSSPGDVKRDKERDRLLSEHGIHVIRVTDNRNPDDTCRQALYALASYTT